MGHFNKISHIVAIIDEDAKKVKSDSAYWQRLWVGKRLNGFNAGAVDRFLGEEEETGKGLWAVGSEVEEAGQVVVNKSVELEFGDNIGFENGRIKVLAIDVDALKKVVEPIFFEPVSGGLLQKSKAAGNQMKLMLVQAAFDKSDCFRLRFS